MYSRGTVSYTGNTEELLGACYQLRSQPHYISSAYVDCAPIFVERLTPSSTQPAPEIFQRDSLGGRLLP